MHGTRQLAPALVLPTRLLFVACYINPIRLCRCVFANVRYCLVSFDDNIIFTRLSKLFIGGVSLALYGHLQIYVLIKLVSRTLEGIRVSLGLSQEYRILGGSVQEEKNGNNLPEKGATPKLIDSIIKDEEINEGNNVFGGGMKALRQEIWELKKLL